jgi:hypothetical protein
MLKLLLALLQGYRLLISPLFPRTCRFFPTCSEYARQALRRYGVRQGLKLTGKRLLKCHPFHPGGWDPLP